MEQQKKLTANEYDKSSVF